MFHIDIVLFESAAVVEHTGMSQTGRREQMRQIIMPLYIKTLRTAREWTTRVMVSHGVT